MTLAVLLSGQGGQHPGMFDLTAALPEAQGVFAAAAPLLGQDPRDLVRSGKDLHANRIGQILCCVAGLAAAGRFGAYRAALGEPAVFTLEPADID